MGRDWVTDHTAFIEPRREVPFTAAWAGEIAVMLADDVETPQSVQIRLGRVLRRLRIEWDGERWGQRGRTGGADAGG